MIMQQNVTSQTGRPSEFIYKIRIFSQGKVHNEWCSAFLPATANMLSQNHCPETHWYVLTFLHPILVCRITNGSPLETLLAEAKNSDNHVLGIKSSWSQ